MYGYIYKTTNLVNNKVYIGKHQGEFNREYLGSGNVLKRAIAKYGEDAFAVVMIGQVLDEKSLRILERYYIAYYRQLLGRDVLYNIADGGQGGNLGPHKEGCLCCRCMNKRGEFAHSEETKKKMKQPKSSEHREHIRLSRLGRPSGMLDKHHTKESIDKIKDDFPDRHGLKNPMFGKKQSELHNRIAREVNLGTTMVNKAGTNKKIHSKDLPEFTSDGWVVGMLTKRRRV